MRISPCAALAASLSTRPLGTSFSGAVSGAVPGTPVLQRRAFAKTKYQRLLWKPSFPSDLPPALRQNAAVVRHAAPEVSPHKKTWTIYASQKIHEIALDLCARGAIEELTANIIYRSMASLNCRSLSEAYRREMDFRSDIFTACSNLFEVHHVHNGAEIIFGALDEDRVKAVSPELRSNKRLMFRDMFTDAIDEWVSLHRHSFGQMDAHKLFEVVGPKTFLSLVPRFRLNLRSLPATDLEVLFYHLNVEKRDLFGLMRVALSMLVDDLEEPLGGSTSWTLRRVLGLIEERRSEHALRFFLANLPSEPLLAQALHVLRERDLDTGLLREKWSFIASANLDRDLRTGRQILPTPPKLWPMVDHSPQPTRRLKGKVAPLAIDVDAEIRRPQQLFLTDGEFRPFSMESHIPQPLAALAEPSKFRDTAWPQLAFDPSEALALDSGELEPSVAVNAYDVASGKAEELDAAELWGGAALAGSSAARAGESSSILGLPHPSGGLPLDNIHFVDSVQALSHVLTFLQHAPPAYVGIDLEWTDPEPVSVIQIATEHRAFVIDCVHRTPLYMSVLHALMDWLMKQEGVTKLFFGFPHDLVRLNMLFGDMGKTFSGRDHISSVLDLYMQRIQRVSVKAPRDEDTPLGRDQLMGEALLRQDFDEIQRLSERGAPPVREDYAEKVFTVGGHHSLNSMTQRYLGETLEKKYAASNWNFRPLAVAQVVYAATDAHILLRLESALRARNILPQRIWGSGPRDGLQPAWWKNSEG